ncbi:MAG: DUF4055 domain-containing protein [Lachnospiraceae bacterium]|nr:DUF4055 domain-containing protein [Lachnospiraceae bacterium]
MAGRVIEGTLTNQNKYKFAFQEEHPEYRKRKAQWKLIRDCVEGGDAIKAAGETYLPRAIGMTDERYKSYISRPAFVNYVDQTLEGTHGMIFRRAPVATIPEKLVEFMENVNREGDNMYQFASDTVYDIMQTNFGGYLVDYPPASDNLNVAGAEKLGVRPYVTFYKAENIINWRFELIKGTKVPTMIVLREQVEMNVKDNPFAHTLAYQYRVLLIEDGIYKQRLYKPDTEKTFIEYEIPIKVNHGKIHYIPFVFAPGNTPDKPMLKDIADVNISHFKKTADYENGVHLTTIPTGVVTGEEPEVDKNKNIQPIYLGADNFLMFPNENAKVFTLCYAGEGLTHVETALDKSELQMVVLGSRIITPEKGISETAESANIHRAGENAKLATFAHNMSNCLAKVLGIVAEFMGVKAVCKYELNTDYETQGFDANALNAMVNLFSIGKVPLIVLYRMMMRGELIDPNMSYEDIVYLLDLENAGLTPSEVNEAYAKFKADNKVKKVRGKKLPTNKEVEDKQLLDPETHKLEFKESKNGEKNKV